MSPATLSLCFVLLHSLPSVVWMRGTPASLQPVCGRPVVQGDSRVIGGTKAKPNSWPWMAFLTFYDASDRRQYICGASVIDESWLLTAGHCAYNWRRGSGRAYIGTTNISQSLSLEQFGYPVLSTSYHPRYNPNTLTNDIALLKLGKKLQFGSAIQPICLSTDDSTIGTSIQSGFVTGWGLYSYAGQTSVSDTPSADLLQAEIPFISPDTCRRYWNKQRVAITADQVCAGGYLKGTGQGDSGGPLQVNANGQWIQVGLTSFGDNSQAALLDQGKYPGVYTRVSRYCSFIKGVVGKDICFRTALAG